MEKRPVVNFRRPSRKYRGVCQTAWAILPNRPLTVHTDRVRSSQSKGSRRNRKQLAPVRRFADNDDFRFSITTRFSIGHRSRSLLFRQSTYRTLNNRVKMQMSHTDPEQNDYEPENALLWVSRARFLEKQNKKKIIIISSDPVVVLSVAEKIKEFVLSDANK